MTDNPQTTSLEGRVHNAMIVGGFVALAVGSILTVAHQSFQQFIAGGAFLGTALGLIVGWAITGGVEELLRAPTAPQPLREFTLKVKHRDGWWVVTSNDVPGLYVAHNDMETTFMDVGPSIRTLMQLNAGVQP